MKTYVRRFGKSQEADEVFLAANSNDLDRMIEAIPLPSNGIDRRFLLTLLSQRLYKLRSDDYYREQLHLVCEKFIEELSDIVNASELDGFPMSELNSPVIKFYATSLSEIGEFAKAINACEVAIQYELNDGTVGGYVGRKEKIKHFQATSN